MSVCDIKIFLRIFLDFHFFFKLDLVLRKQNTLGHMFIGHFLYKKKANNFLIKEMFFFIKKLI